jgi:hypothetical protein
LISLALYVALLVVLYAFFAVVKEATKLEVALTVFVLPVVALTLFFSLQAMGLGYTRIGVGAGYLLKRALKDCWKLLLVSLPVFLLAWLLIRFIPIPATRLAGAEDARPWLRVIALGALYLLLCFALPLSAIHLWMAAAREGVAATFKGIKRHILTAFSPQSAMIYLLVVVVFGLIAWFLLFTKIRVGSDWGELWLFGFRLALALLVVFVGWLITLGAMAEMITRRAINEMGS